MATIIPFLRRSLGLPPSLKIARALYGFSLLAVLVRLALFVIYEPYVEGDTRIVVKDVQAIRACLSEGRLLGCTYDGPFPPLQYVPGLILSYLGFSDSAILHFLAYLSFLSFVASTLLIFRALKRKATTPLAALAVLIIWTGPLLWYSHSTYGEMIAAWLILAFTVASLTRVPNRILVPLFVLASTTKDVAFPFLLLIGLLGLLPEVVTAPGKIRRRLWGLMLGVALSLIINVAFNYFHYATFYNQGHLRGIFIVPTLKLQLGFALAIWFSPSGGLSFFWPSFVFLYFSLLILLFTRAASDRRMGRHQEPYQRLIFYMPVATISLILILLTLGFAKWYTPLGGAAWGPRLILPWIPAALLLLLYFYAQEITAALSVVLSKTFSLVLTCVVLIVVSLPQLMILFGSFVLGHIFFSPTPDCPRLPVVQEDVVYYYRCLQAQLWPNKFVLLELYRVALSPAVFGFTVSYCIILVGTCMWIRKRLAGGEPSLASESPVPEANLRADAVESGTAKAAHGPIPHWLGVLLFYSLLYTIFFSPVLFSGHLFLAPGDGVPIYLPNFFSRKVLWDTLMFGGFPMFADPQIMMWYPLEILFSHIPGGWNIFVLSAYVLASCFMYGYVHTVTHSRLSALASGIVYGMSGFMMAHLGHIGIIHAAAWLPLIIWSLETLRRKWNPLWFAAGSIAIGLCFFAGQSQIFFLSLLLSTCYALTLGWTASVGRSRYYLYALLMIGLGTGLAAIQFIPTAELVNQSIRREFSFAEFVAFSMPPNQLITLVFPSLFGASNDPHMPYFGLWNSTELAGYVGLLPLMLAAIGFAAYRRKPLALFWLVAGLLALVLALGDVTPLARIIYHVPVMNRFRAPARHLLEMTFAVSVLAGLGINAIRQGEVRIKIVWKTILISALVIVAGLVAITASNSFSDQLIADAVRAGIPRLNLLPWANSAVGIPLVIFLLAAGGLAYWRRKPNSSSRTVLLFVVLALDLASFGWFYEWQYASPDEANLWPPAGISEFARALNATHQRFLPIRGFRGMLDEIPPNLSRMWGVPSANGHNVLRLERYSRMLAMQEGRNVDASWSNANDQGVNLAAIRYLIVPRGDVMRDKDGISWLNQDLDLWVGNGCNNPVEEASRSFTLPQPYRTTRVGLVSMLACSTGIGDGTEVARLSVTDTGGRVQTRSLVAGRDASEWSYDCSNIKPQMQHQRATVFESFPAKMYDVSCEGHHYVAMLNLDEAADIKSISIQWAASVPGAFVIQKISLIDDSTRASNLIDLQDLDSSRWRLVEETDKTRLYENLRVMPRVWLTHEVAQVKPEEALVAVKTSRLPDGRDFDPSRTALVEETLSPISQATDPASSAEVVSLSDRVMEVRTSSASPSFLVTSDSYYPGWQVSVDGQPANLLRADYALRGVMLSAGQHLVRFEFRPRSYYYGAATSAMSLLVLVLIVSNALLFHLRRRRVLTH